MNNKVSIRKYKDLPDQMIHAQITSAISCNLISTDSHRITLKYFVSAFKKEDLQHNRFRSKKFLNLNGRFNSLELINFNSNKRFN